MTRLQSTLETLSRLIALDSVSSNSNAEISAVVSERLESLGFSVQQDDYLDEAGVRKVNVVAKRDPQGPSADSDGGLAYFCHTDVVPAVDWTGPGGDPFQAVIEDERVYGRGACDMKGSLVTMMEAAGEVSAKEQRRPVWFVATADEEVGFEGVKHLSAHSADYREMVQAQPVTIIGEPTRLAVVHAHKGIVGFRITSRGRAAHSSSTDGVNANEAMVPMLQKLLELANVSRGESRYRDLRFDPPVLSWNFGVSDGCRAVNITPGKSVAWFSLRPMPGVDGEDLIARAQQTAESLGMEFRRYASGEPMWVEPDSPHIREMTELAGGEPITVCYGTDGGELSELRKRVVFGPGDIAQAHTTDEWISFEQLQRGSEKYAAALRRWC